MLKVGIVGCGMIGKEHAKRIQYKISSIRSWALKL